MSADLLGTLPDLQGELTLQGGLQELHPPLLGHTLINPSRLQGSSKQCEPSMELVKVNLYPLPPDPCLGLLLFVALSPTVLIPFTTFFVIYFKFCYLD